MEALSACIRSSALLIAEVRVHTIVAAIDYFVY